jgi:hypothetical protein
MTSRSAYVWTAVLFSVCAWPVGWAQAADGIDIYPANPRYWQYQGKPVVLIGGSKDDNLFQIPDLEAHLDLLRSVGGNYVRNTMSARNDKGFEVQAFAQRPDGKYDLDRWNDEYWRRFESLLSLAEERDIIIQIEVWDRFDYSRENWEASPHNPKNNVNYTCEASGFAEHYPNHPGSNEQPFFFSTPGQRNNTVVLPYQQRFVDKMLSHSLKHGNVLYCMDNETSGEPAWGAYWAQYIQARAKAAGVKAHTTEMWDAWDLSDPSHSATFDHPELYSFIDISQNNHQKGQAHWDNAQKQRTRIADRPRPLNSTKIYGADTGRFGNDRDGMERFWRNIFGGLASARFHRPDSGLGLGEKAQANLKSMRMLLDEIDAFTCEPHNDLLSDRQENEAYCFANPGTEYAVYFPDGGKVTLDAGALKSPATMQWLNVLKSEWSQPRPVEGPGKLTLECPSQDYWVVLVR